MSKILAVADIHINDYANRNPSNRFRLYQTRTVAQNIIEVGKREGCDTIVFAGDIVEKCIIRPYIQGEVKLFLDTVMAEFKEGYIIWGNHDLDGKSVDQDISDAFCDKYGITKISDRYFIEFISRFNPDLYSGR